MTKPKSLERVLIDLCKAYCTDETIGEEGQLFAKATQEILELLPEEKKKDYAGGGGDKWLRDELQKEVYNQVLQDVRKALGGGLI